VAGIILNGGDRVELRASVVGDVGGVVAKQVPVAFLDQGEERRVTKNATVDGAAKLAEQRRSLAPRQVGVLGIMPAEYRRDIMAGVREFAHKPEPCKGARAREEDFHRTILGSSGEVPCWVELAMVGILFRDHRGCKRPGDFEPRVIPSD